MPPSLQMFWFEPPLVSLAEAVPCVRAPRSKELLGTGRAAEQGGLQPSLPFYAADFWRSNSYERQVEHIFHHLVGDSESH